MPDGVDWTQARRPSSGNRSGQGGKLKMEASGKLLPVDPATGLDCTGFTDNWWIGLSMLHTLFALEHNYLCDELAKLTGFETGVHPGPVTCTETDHQCHKTPAWIQLVGDRIELVAVTPVKK